MDKNLAGAAAGDDEYGGGVVVDAIAPNPCTEKVCFRHHPEEYFCCTRTNFLEEFGLVVGYWLVGLDRWYLIFHFLVRRSQPFFPLRPKPPQLCVLETTIHSRITPTNCLVWDPHPSRYMH